MVCILALVMILLAAACRRPISVPDEKQQQTEQNGEKQDSLKAEGQEDTETAKEDSSGGQASSGS